MPFLTEVRFQNYRSFLDAGCRLAPVTVVIGANNAGKSNFLRNVRDGVIGDYRPDHKLLDDLQFESHRNHPDAPRRITLYGKNSFLLKREPQPSGAWVISPNGVLGIRGAGYYELNEKLIGNEEAEIDEAFVQLDGRGVTGLMRWLQINDETAFRRVEEDVRRYVPEVEELVPKLMGDKKIRLEAKERGLDRTSPLAQLSAGSRIIIALLAILHQPVRPELILLEDIEHAIHPRGLKPLVETMRRISKERGAQIIFTTQSPYVLDAFQAKEYWDDVVIVEKHDGVSTLTNARDRLEALGYEREMTKVPLGDLRSSGLLGGVAGPNEWWDNETPENHE